MTHASAPFFDEGRQVKSDADPISLTRAWTALTGVYRFARHLPDRLLHRRRHLALLRRLLRAPRPRSILVVCYGNICRSPYLQAVLQRTIPDVTVSSAGFVGINRPVPQVSLEVSAERGVDLSDFRSQPLTRELVRSADYIIVMDSRQANRVRRAFNVNRERLIVAGDLDPFVAPTRAIRDPWMHPPEVFEASFARLDRCAAAVNAVLERKALQSEAKTEASSSLEA